MSTMRVDRERCTLCGECIETCPFDGIEMTPEGIAFTELCRLCRLCIKACPAGALALHKEQESAPQLDRDAHQGVLIFAEQRHGRLHPVTYEMLGQGIELAAKLNQEVSVFLAGYNLDDAAQQLLHYGPHAVYVYDHEQLEHFRIEPYTHALVHLVQEVKPNILLMGATPIGRSLAPRVAARLRTGLTADCTSLSVKENGDLVQTRPAFGGNVMAQIVTPHHRPQMATVRYQVMPAASLQEVRGKVVQCHLPDHLLRSNIQVLDFRPHNVTESIADAEIIVAGGRGIDKPAGLDLLNDLATLLGGALGVTRPLVERGWADSTQQIGMSGRTVRPRLYIACGISGAIQHVAGMRGADFIMAINHDPQAPIFDVAHYGLVGDLYEVVPSLIEYIKEGATLSALQ